ncbi:MAG TPA: hypothetical protein DEQ38_00650 [Elusimicrobia bacterium]|nr:MAG: hypothetical protein A2089_05735 [Elusimicrobia bacterium GWD2_63_28]HCC46621.1 hypothetical protein [Elusimicrobiota bacterium]
MKKTALFLLCALLPLGAAAQEKKAAPSGGRMTLYLEAMDGQGWQWFFIADTIRRGLPAADLKVSPLVTKMEDGSFSSRRGEAELAEATRIAVLAKTYPGKLLVYLNARSLSPSADGWKDAALFAGLNPDALEKQAASGGQAALAEAHKKSAAAGASETSIFIDGKRFEGPQRLMPLYEAVNAGLPAAKRAGLPAGYTPKPRPPAPGFWVVTSSGIAKNDALIGVFDRYFEGIKAQHMDYASPERAARFPDLAFAPSYIVAATPEAKSRLESEIKAGLFKEIGGYLVYEDRQRRGLYAGRPEKKNTLEVFVMSQCPYGVMAEAALLDAKNNKLLPEGLQVEIHYIGDSAKDDKGALTFSSLHGQPEWEENARQIFISKNFPDKFDAYLAERNKDYTSPDWQKAAKASGVDAEAVEKGFPEAKELLAADFAATGALGISTSPSFMVDGRHFVVGLGELMKLPGFEKLPPPGQPGAGCAAK